MLTVDTIPLRLQTRGLGDTGTRGEPHRVSVSPRLRVGPSLGLFMISVFAATATELAELKPIGRGLFILGRYVVAAFACITLKNNIIACHLLISDFRLRISSLFSCVDGFQSAIGNWKSAFLYSTTSLTVPAPTVRPPSRMANRNPFSIAIGAINSISIATLSPGITISTPAGRCATPVTSVVRK